MKDRDRKIEVTRDDILKAAAKFAASDIGHEVIKENPLMMMIIGMIAAGITQILFGDEEEEEE